MCVCIEKTALLLYNIGESCKFLILKYEIIKLVNLYVILLRVSENESPAKKCQ